MSNRRVSVTKTKHPSDIFKQEEKKTIVRGESFSPKKLSEDKLAAFQRSSSTTSLSPLSKSINSDNKFSPRGSPAAGKSLLQRSSFTNSEQKPTEQNLYTTGKVPVASSTIELTEDGNTVAGNVIGVDDSANSDLSNPPDSINSRIDALAIQTEIDSLPIVNSVRDNSYGELVSRGEQHLVGAPDDTIPIAASPISTISTINTPCADTSSSHSADSKAIAAARGSDIDIGDGEDAAPADHNHVVDHDVVVVDSSCAICIGIALPDATACCVASENDEVAAITINSSEEAAVSEVQSVEGQAVGSEAGSGAGLGAGLGALGAGLDAGLDAGLGADCGPGAAPNSSSDVNVSDSASASHAGIMPSSLSRAPPPSPDPTPATASTSTSSSTSISTCASTSKTLLPLTIPTAPSTKSPQMSPESTSLASRIFVPGFMHVDTYRQVIRCCSLFDIYCNMTHGNVALTEYYPLSAYFMRPAVNTNVPKAQVLVCGGDDSDVQSATVSMKTTAFVFPSQFADESMLQELGNHIEFAFVVETQSLRPREFTDTPQKLTCLNAGQPAQSYTEALHQNPGEYVMESRVFEFCTDLTQLHSPLARESSMSATINECNKFFDKENLTVCHSWAYLLRPCCSRDGWELDPQHGDVSSSNAGCLLSPCHGGKVSGKGFIRRRLWSCVLSRRYQPIAITHNQIISCIRQHYNMCLLFDLADMREVISTDIREPDLPVMAYLLQDRVVYGMYSSTNSIGVLNTVYLKDKVIRYLPNVESGEFVVQIMAAGFDQGNLSHFVGRVTSHQSKRELYRRQLQSEQLVELCLVFKDEDRARDYAYALLYVVTGLSTELDYIPLQQAAESIPFGDCVNVVGLLRSTSGAEASDTWGTNSPGHPGNLGASSGTLERNNATRGSMNILSNAIQLRGSTTSAVGAGSGAHKMGDSSTMTAGEMTAIGNYSTIFYSNSGKSSSSSSYNASSRSNVTGSSAASTARTASDITPRLSTGRISTLSASTCALSISRTSTASSLSSALLDPDQPIDAQSLSQLSQDLSQRATELINTERSLIRPESNLRISSQEPADPESEVKGAFRIQIVRLHLMDLTAEDLPLNAAPPVHYSATSTPSSTPDNSPRLHHDHSKGNRSRENSDDVCDAAALHHQYAAVPRRDMTLFLTVQVMAPSKSGTQTAADEDETASDIVNEAAEIKPSCINSSENTITLANFSTRSIRLPIDVRNCCWELPPSGTAWEIIINPLSSVAVTALSKIVVQLHEGSIGKDKGVLGQGSLQMLLPMARFLDEAVVNINPMQPMALTEEVTLLIPMQPRSASDHYVCRGRVEFTFLVSCIQATTTTTTTTSATSSSSTSLQPIQDRSSPLVRIASARIRLNSDPITTALKYPVDSRANTSSSNSLMTEVTRTKQEEAERKMKAALIQAMMNLPAAPSTYSQEQQPISPDVHALTRNDSADTSSSSAGDISGSKPRPEVPTLELDAIKPKKTKAAANPSGAQANKTRRNTGVWAGSEALAGAGASGGASAGVQAVSTPEPHTTGQRQAAPDQDDSLSQPKVQGCGCVLC